MRKTHSGTGIDESYYECLSCGYTATADLALGSCPLCGDTLSSTAVLGP